MRPGSARHMKSPRAVHLLDRLHGGRFDLDDAQRKVPRHEEHLRRTNGPSEILVAAPRGQPDGGDHRKAERERRKKRGRSIDAGDYDAGKRIKGKRRYLLVNTQGLLLYATVHAAEMHGRDGGALLMTRCSACSRSCRSCMSTAAIRGRSFSGHSITCASRSMRRSSSAPITAFHRATQPIDR